MRAWFLERYCDPAQDTPYNGREGGYQFIHGDPYDPADVLPDRFARVVEDDVIQEVIDELHQQVGDQWAPVPLRLPRDYDEDYGVIVESSGQPLAKLRERLAQSKQVLTLQGNFSAQLLARNLAFGSVITSLESFLWETVIYWVDHDGTTIINIVSKIQVFRDQPPKLGQIFEKRDNLKDDIKAYLQDLVWHQWSKVAPLFTLGLGIDIPGFKQFEDALIKCHDIVHRSGFSKTGERVEVDEAEIEALCEQIIRFANEINEKLAKPEKRECHLEWFIMPCLPESGGCERPFTDVLVAHLTRAQVSRSKSPTVIRGASGSSEATNTDGNFPRKNLTALSRKDHCSSTSSMEQFEVSPDAERHGGFSTLRKLVANEWRRRLRHSRICLFLCELRNTCACPPSISSILLRTNWM
jgi:hypothetical protein